MLDVHVCLLKVNSSMVFIKSCQYLCSLNPKKMKKEIIRLCDYCHGVIPFTRNYNSKFCCEECYKKNKSEVAAKLQRDKVHSLLMLSNDEIIHDLYLKYESKYYITAKELIDRGFNWTIYTASKTINNLPAKTLIRYGYTLFNNQTVQLWKL